MTDASDFTMADSAPEPPPSDGPAFVPDDRRRVKTLDSSLDAVMPCNVEAEKVVLAAILLDNSAFSEVAERLESEDFSLDSHRRIFLRMSELVDANQAVDIVTLAAELTRHKEVEVVGGVAYLASLTEGVPRRPAITEYIAILKNKSALRRIMAICSLAIARAADQSDSSMEILEYAEGALLQIAQEANSGKLKTIYESVQEAGGVEPYLKACTDPEITPGLLTGFADYDAMTGGLHKSELIIIAARPSMGKTAWAMNIAQNAAFDNQKVIAVFSLEMTRGALEQRMMASRAWVDMRKAQAGWLGRDEKVKLETALLSLIETNIFIDDSATLTPVQLRAKSRRLKQKEGRLDLIIVDYLQLMSAGARTGSREQEIALISRSLKACAKELEVPVVALAQLNRDPEKRQDKRPMLSDLRESGQLEQDADVVAFIHRPSMYNQDEETTEAEKALAEIILAKQRSGPTGIVNLVFISKHTRFDNLARS